MGKIDFVITWVDNTDPVWQKDFHTYLPQSQYMYDTRNIRYRNWENLRYWFRGVEKFAPWVNKVHFVTCGQVPDWLNLNAPKLHVVKHSDYMPAEYLPTFNSDSILLNLHRIEGLSEHFVLFDDDMFLLDKIKPEQFFRKGLPCDIAALTALCPVGIFSHNRVNNVCIINSSFNKYDVMRKHFWKWFSPQAGRKRLRTLLLLPWRHFTGFYDSHFPQVLLKSTFEEVWECHEDVLLRTTAARFRSITNVGSWLFRYWQLAKGNFVPLNVQKSGIYLEISDSELDKIVNIIEYQKKKIVCLNDGDTSVFLTAESFEKAKEQINSAFQKILFEKSSFEK